MTRHSLETTQRQQGNPATTLDKERLLLQLLDNYEALAADMEYDPAYVARGNGFCEAKYSDDFLLEQIKTIKEKLADVRKAAALHPEERNA